MENQGGVQYSLNKSMFERLVTMEPASLRYDTLETQRRMDPSTSNLIRQSIYPDLMDHKSVSTYPEVAGMRDRLFWLDHNEWEDHSNASTAQQTSHSNVYEISLVEAMVTHLIRQGIYKSDDIVVLTPYVRQLQKIRNQLARSFDIVIDDRDVDEMRNKGLFEDPATKGRAFKAMLTERLRIATVDNFQGEEAKVVIVSLVRSNQERRCGFLKTRNRINVLLSRAKHGMYIIGNTQTAQRSEMWSLVIRMLKANGNLDTSLSLRCSQHPETSIEVRTPDDFATKAPEGGCDLLCDLRMDCGHKCPYKCHSIARHEAVICNEPCTRSPHKCGHPCLRRCGDECGDCITRVSNTRLPCGHYANKLFCYQTSNLKEVRCVEKIDVTGRCDHRTSVPCGTDPSDIHFRCSAECGAALECGHQCIKKCHQCRTTNDEGIISVSHGQCRRKCDRAFSTCAHACQADCHDGTPCPPCTIQCDIRRDRSKCAKLCKEPCAPCLEACTAGCEHQGFCTMPCCVPCDILPCSRRCNKQLECGHQCPSVCGEHCPDQKFCQDCAEPQIADMEADYIEGRKYSEIDLDEAPCIVPSCGHIITIESMDGIMGLAEHYKLNGEGIPVAPSQPRTEPLSTVTKGCPACRGALRDINRYNRIIKRALLDESTKKFIVWSNQEFVPLTSALQNQESLLQSNHIEIPGVKSVGFKQSSVAIRGSPKQQVDSITGLSGLNARLRPIFNLYRDMSKLADKIIVDEQPFAKVGALAIKQSGAMGEHTTFTFDKEAILQTRIYLLITSLKLRCNFDFVSDLLNIYNNHQESATHFHEWLRKPLTFDLAKSREECSELIEGARAKQQWMVVVEGLILYAKFAALERSAPADPLKTTLLADDARAKMELARMQVGKAPSTAIMLSEIEAVEKMLRGDTFYTTVTSAEKQAVYAAMAQEFSGTGHWYYCENMHPYTVGECGMPMQASRCPQCGAAVGGQSHQNVAGATHAADMDAAFTNLTV